MTVRCMLLHWDFPYMNAVHIHYFLWLIPFKHCCKACQTGCYKVEITP